MSFILLCGTTIVPLNNFDNFVYISLYLYGGNVHFFCGISDKFAGAMGWKHHKFPIETLKTSEFFVPNLGCLCPKLRNFSSQKSDVFGFRTLFYAEIPGFSPFLPRNPQSPTLVFSPPVPPLLGSEALLSAPKSQIILTKSPSSSSRR